MSQDKFPDRDPAKTDQQQGVYNKYKVTRTDGKPNKAGAEFFVLDLANDKYAKPAIAAYAEACMAEYPQLAKDIAARWLVTPEAPAPQPPSVSAAVAPGREWAQMRITVDRMMQKGLSETTAKLLAPDGDILWHELVKRDGMLALSCLDDDMLAPITAQLRADGAPAAVVNTPAGVAHLLYMAAESYCPETKAWNTRALTSAVATALLLRLAESVWRGKQIVIAHAGQMPQ